MRESVVLVFLPVNAVRVLLESLHVVTTARHGGDGGATVTRSAMLWIHSIWALNRAVRAAVTEVLLKGGLRWREWRVSGEMI